MDRETPLDSQVEGWLDTLGIESRCQWDVLVFLYRHPISLLGAESLACLLGYPSGSVVAALDALEALRLVERSRVSQGVRLYRITAPAGTERGGAAEGLFALANSRAARVVLSKKLRAGGRTPREGLQATQRLSEEDQ
jgi:DNA-binding transcriptional ArsR family regulator